MVILVLGFGTCLQRTSKNDVVVGEYRGSEDMGKRRLCSHALVEVEVALSCLWSTFAPRY
jgi:hypothetical protein